MGGHAAIRIAEAPRPGSENNPMPAIEPRLAAFPLARRGGAASPEAGRWPRIGFKGLAERSANIYRSFTVCAISSRAGGGAGAAHARAA